MPQTRHYEMKDSGVGSVGNIPKHWRATSLKRALCAIKDGTHGTYERVASGKMLLSAKNVFDDGIHIGNSESLISEESFNEVISSGFPKKGDVLMCIVGTIGRACVYEKKEPMAFQRSVAFLRPNELITSQFLKYTLQSPSTIEEEELSSNGTAQVGLYLGAVQKLPVILPPLSEQTAIAAYLDEKCTTIDAIITEAKASIEEYKSWKASVIFETVTKGLNPNAEMKDSGVEWIGSIPKAWQYVPLKYLASCNDEVLTEATPEDYTFDYIDIGSVHTGNGIGMCERMQFKDAPSRARRIVRDGDIIVSTVRTYLKAIAQVGNYDVPHIASTGFAVIRTKNANASFLKYALLSDNFVSQVEADSVGISYPAINATQIMAFKIPVPSIAEQTDIALYLDDKCAAIDGVIAEKEALIGELESYKKSLIFETVTGKRRVC